MHSLLFKKFFKKHLLWWPLIRASFYIFYFVVIQIINSMEWTYDRFKVNILIFITAIFIIEVSLRCFRLFFYKKRYLKAVLICSINYSAIALIGYYVLHSSDNFVAREIWNREVDASWTIFLLNFSQFYGAFFKYAVILFLVEHMLFLLRVISFRTGKNSVRPSEMEPMLSDRRSQIANPTELKEKDLVSSSLARKSDLQEFDNNSHILPIKARSITYMLNIFKIVYLEVCNEITTVYQLDGSHFKVNIPLSKFCEWLPESRFMRVHESRVVALPYIIKEKGDCLYMLGYENLGLKLGRSEKYLGKYKEWKENTRSKWDDNK